MRERICASRWREHASMWMGIPLLLFAFGAQGVTRGEAYEVESGKDKYWCGCGSRERDLVPTVFLSVNFFVWIFFCWPKILGRHVSSTGGRDDTFSGKKKENLTDWPWMMTSIILVFLSECLRSSFFRHTLHCTLPKQA